MRWILLVCLVGGSSLAASSGWSESLLLKARLEGLVDSQVLISTPASKPQRRILVKRGVPEVVRREEVRHDTLFRGRYYRTFEVAAEVGTDELRTWQERMGKEVKVMLQRGPGNHLVVETVLASGK